MNLVLKVFVVILGLSGCIGAPDVDEVGILPGIGFNISFKHYSGYLKGSEGKQLHYWFTESTNDPAKDPVMLWLNGGPGCSSLLGLFTENGPFRIGEDGKTILENPYSWNKIANVLFLEAPGCVGFSYDVNGNCSTNDDQTALSNYNALQDFFTNKFPEYIDNEFFITGESYGGVYVPTLTELVEKGLEDFPLKLSGFAIGNGITSWIVNINSNIFFGYFHGLYGDELWDKLVKNCCNDSIASKENCNFYEPPDSTCKEATNEALNIIYGGYLNQYNLYEGCAHQSPSYLKRYLADLKGLRMNQFMDVERFMEGRNMPKDAIPCLDYTDLIAYLNSPELKEAAHIPKEAPKWDVCSDILQYEQTYVGMEEQYKYLLPKLRCLIYNGDVDMACNFLGAEWFFENMDLEVVKGRRMWYSSEKDKVVGGFVKQFKNLDLLTVLGSGHMVPEDKPLAAFKMISSFVKNEPY